MLTRLIVLLIRIYQYCLSPVLKPQCCRFYPTCSEYTLDAITKFGLWRGVRLALRRLGRCHPFGGSGFDPLPEASRSPREE